MPKARYALAMACVLCIPATAAGPDSTGKVALSAPESGAGPGQQEDEDRLEALRGLGYVAWDPGADTELKGVTRHDPAKTAPGFNLHALGSDEVHLMDLDGRTVHAWKVPGRKRACDHAELLHDGLLAVICTMDSLTLLRGDSTVVLEVKLPVHHDVAELGDGSLLVPIRKTEPYQFREVMFDSIVKVGRDGQVEPFWSTFDHLEDLRKHHPPSPLDTPPPLRQRMSGESGDYYHLNTIEVLPDTDLGGKDRRFRAGNLLICLRNASLIAVLDGKDHSILWSWGPGDLQEPHMPTLLPNGHLLIFDNGVTRKYSRVVEMDPVEKRIVWEYEGDPPSRFFSKTRGSNQRLANGNTLICESERGHAFEVSPGGEMVWEFWNPELMGGARKRLYRMMRLPEARVARFLAVPEKAAEGPP